MMFTRFAALDGGLGDHNLQVHKMRYNSSTARHLQKNKTYNGHVTAQVMCSNLIFNAFGHGNFITK